MRHPESDMRRSEPGPMRRPEPAPVRPSQPPGRMSPREMHAAQPGPHGSSLRPRESDAMTRPIQQQSRPDESARPHLADAHRGHSGGPPVSNSGSPMPSSPRGMAAAPASTLDQVISNLDRNLSARGIEQSPGEREFDEAATVDASLEDLGLSDDEPEHQDEVTMRAKLGAMGNPRQPDGDNETVRLHLSELQKLVSASVDPKLDD